ncbi:TPA: immunoglobulin domain-containing protein [Escherichia coli]|nr:immunoglobulin domain-containing protein [Escherichia coli]
MSYTGLLDQDEGYSIRITKLPPMSFTTDLTANKTITKGQALTLSVVVKGGAEPYTYVWKKGGVVIPDAKQATYTKSNAQEADAGQYVCEVTDSHGRTIPSTPCLVAVNPGE